MTRDKQLVSDVERDRALVDIIASIKNCKIKLTTGDRSYVKETGMIDYTIPCYVITLSSPAVKGIETFTALNHECWHILFDSQFKIIYDVISKWTGGGMEVNKASYYKYVINILEDTRIESLGAKIWLGTGKRFEKMRDKRGAIIQKSERKKAEDISPANLLLYIRFNQGEHYTTNKYFLAMKQALKDVELTGKYGSIKVMKRIKPLLDEWWEENILDDHKKFESSGWVIPADYMGEEATTENSYWASGEHDIPDEEIKKEKERGEEVIKEVKDKMSNAPVGSSEDLSYVVHVERPEAEAIYNENISSSMRKLFKKLSMMSKAKINDQGNEIDIESYITNKIERKNLNECLIDKKLERGICLLLSVDVSSSMNGDKISTARELVGTLFKSVEGLDNVEIKAQTWSSNREGKITIQEINKYKDVKNVNTGYGGETPTHLAIDYAVRTAKKMRGEKKLIIILTDGHPQYHKNNYRFYLTQLIKMAQKSMRRALHYTPNIMCIHIGGIDELGTMKTIFGSRFMHTNNMSEASETIIKRFRELVVRTMLK